MTSFWKVSEEKRISILFSDALTNRGTFRLETLVSGKTP